MEFLTAKDYLDSLTPEELDNYIKEDALRSLRDERNKRLTETDWWASTDLTMTDAQLKYRQDLRDITLYYSSLLEVEWPIKP